MAGDWKFSRVNKERSENAKTRKSLFLANFAVTKSIDEALNASGATQSMYSGWRWRDKEFARRVDAYRVDGKAPGKEQYAGGFASFRLEYFRMSSPWFHLAMIREYENTPPGNITMFLLPPEHGKTTLFEDYASYTLSQKPDHRFTVGSENKTLSRKIIGRVRNRLTRGGPFPRFVAEWGPFEPQQGNTLAQPWGSDNFDVFAKTSHDERDYSMQALGMGSAVAGTRTDHLHVDDPQSLKSIAQTESMVEQFRQDWLSRPGEEGIVTIAGTRVDEDDFYEVLCREFPPEIMRVIKLPAIVPTVDGKGVEPLFPEKYTMEQLERLKIKAGPEGWARNFMQAPAATKLKTFTNEIIGPALNPMRSLEHHVPMNTTGILGLDPSIGGLNAIMGCAFHAGMLKLVQVSVRTGLMTNEAILTELRDQIIDFQIAGGVITDVVIETMAFQKGLAEDRQLLEMQDEFGFTVRPHMTGLNKYDQNIGIASMARDFRRGAVELPYAGDEATRHTIDAFITELKAWRPYVKGNRLRQDRLMALWFCWIVWRDRRGEAAPDAKQFNFSGMPYAQTHSGLIVPKKKGRAA